MSNLFVKKWLKISEDCPVSLQGNKPGSLVQIEVSKTGIPRKVLWRQVLQQSPQYIRILDALPSAKKSSKISKES